jgi:hypothetical protein
VTMPPELSAWGDRTGHELPVAGRIRGALAYERGLRAARRHRRSRLLPRAAGPLAPDVRPSVCRCEPEWWASVCGQTEERLLGDIGPRAKYPSSVLFTPYLSGEWTPHNDPHMRGGFSRLGHDGSRGHDRGGAGGRCLLDLTGNRVDALHASIRSRLLLSHAHPMTAEL